MVFVCDDNQREAKYDSRHKSQSRSNSMLCITVKCPRERTPKCCPSSKPKSHPVCGDICPRKPRDDPKPSKWCEPQFKMNDNELPDIMICKKCPSDSSSKKSFDCDSKHKNAKDVELIGGILYRDCLCNRRNGLQDRCPRTDCRGRPECLTKPYPICKPGVAVRERNKRNEKQAEEHMRKRYRNTVKSSGNSKTDKYECVPLCQSKRKLCCNAC